DNSHPEARLIVALGWEKSVQQREAPALQWELAVDVLEDVQQHVHGPAAAGMRSHAPAELSREPAHGFQDVRRGGVLAEVGWVGDVRLAQQSPFDASVDEHLDTADSQKVVAQTGVSAPGPNVVENLG